MADRGSDGERPMALPSLRRRRTLSIVQLAGRISVVTLYWTCLQILSLTINKRVRQLGIPINKAVVDAILLPLQVWILPKAILELLSWHSSFSFRDHLLVPLSFCISGITRYSTEHIKDIALKGIFFSRTPRERYAYTELPRDSPSIRLLEYRRTTIFPLLEKCNLEYNIRIFPLTRAPEYTAVSYTWGDATSNKFIALQDGTTQYVLAITTSAMECLVALRNRRRYIWIDSVCINQWDMDEKMKQVEIMRDIYGTAAEVVAVLGSSVMATIGPCNTACEILRHSVEHHYSVAESLMRSCMLKGGNTNDNEVGEEGEFYTTMVTDMHSPLRTRALLYLRHPYWIRVWIIQEITVAKSVLVYSDRSFRELDSWFEIAETYRKVEDSVAGPNRTFSYGRNQFHDCLSKLGRTSNIPERVIEEELSRSYSRGVERLLSIREMRRRYHELQKEIDFQDAMLLSMNSLATNARDKVFGVVGILSTSDVVAVDNAEMDIEQWIDPEEESCINAKIVPNYELSINEVFVDASTVLATSGAGKLILLLGGIGWARCQPNLPSWAIDWTSLPPLYPRGNASIQQTGCYQANWTTWGESAARKQLLPLDRATILGTFNFIDEIKFISETIEPNGHTWFPEVWNEICSRIGESYLWSTWPCPREEAVWRTLLAQRGISKPRDHCYDSECHLDETIISKYIGHPDKLTTLRSQEKKHTCREDVDRAFLAWSPVHTVSFDKNETAALSDRFSEVLSYTRAIGCRFAVTGKGYIGTVPPISSVGDRISIHPICPVPLVLRKVAYQYGNLGSGQKKYSSHQLIGSCYVLGLMNGEPACGGTANKKFYGVKESPFPDRKIALI